MALPRILLFALLVGSSCAFEQGKKYVYKYETDVGTVDGYRGTDVSNAHTQYKILAEAHLMPVWTSHSDGGGQLIQVLLDNPQLQVVSKRRYRPLKTEFLSSPVYVHSVRGRVKSVFCTAEENRVLRGIKKGIFTLLSQKSVVEDEDSCNVTRSADGSSKNIERACAKVFQPKRQTSYLRTALVKRKTREEYQFDSNDLLVAADAEERVELFSPLRSSANVSVQTRTRLRFEAIVAGQPSLEVTDVHQAVASLNGRGSEKFVEEKTLLPNVFETDKPKCDLEASVIKHKKYLKSKNVGNSSSASAFSALLPCVRGATKEEIKKVLGNKKFAKVLPQLLDVVAFAGTDEAVDAAFETVRFVDADLELINRFLLPFLMNQHPTRKMILAVQKAVEEVTSHQVNLAVGRRRDKQERLEANEPVLASLVSALGGLSRTLALTGTTEDDRGLVADVDAFLRMALDSCENPDCILTYLRAIRSMALSSSKDLLLRLSSAEGKVSYEALSALRDTGFHNDPQCEQFCHRIFHQLDAKQETEKRLVAAEMLMDCYSQVSTLEELLSELQEQEQFEMASYLASRIAQKMEEEPKFKKDILIALKRAKQYYSLAQKGNSVFFKNEAIEALSHWTRMLGLNATYSVGIELTPEGVLNRHNTDIMVYYPGGSERLLSASSYTQGLSSFFASAADPGVGEDVEPSASLDLVVNGIALPPIVFFKGMTDMIHKALSSENTVPEIRGNYLVAELFEEAKLLNGLPVTLRVEAIVSNTIYGSFEMSLWSQTSKTTVTDEVALMLQGSVSVSAGFLELENHLSLQSEFDVHVISNAEFYEQPYLSCTEASHKDVYIKYQKQSSLQAPNGGFSQRRTKKKRWTVAGRSYAIHKKNNEMCAVMKYR